MFKSIKEVKKQLSSKDEANRLVALSEILKYGQEGLDLLIQQSLDDQSERIRKEAYWIFRGDHSCFNENRARQNTTCSTDSIISLAISSDNRTLTGGSWQRIWVWNLSDGRVLHTINGHLHWILSVAISPDGNTLVSGSADRTVKVWNLNNGQLIHSLSFHQSWVTAVAISSDGKTLVSGSVDKTIKIWDLSTGKLIKNIKSPKWLSSVLSLCISPDGQTIVSGSSDNTVTLWNLKNGNFIRNLEAHSDWVQSIAITSDGTTLISGSRNGDIKVWQAKDRKKVLNRSPNLWFRGLLDLSGVASLFINPLVGILLLATGIVISLRKKDDTKYSELLTETLECIKSCSLNNSVHSIACNLERNLAVIGSHKNLRAYNLKIDKIIYSLQQRFNRFTFVSVSSDGKIIATSGKDWITLLDAKTGKPIHSIKGCSYPRLSKITLGPSKELFYGQSHTLNLKGLDQNGQEMKLDDNDITWGIAGGQIQGGIFTAGQVEGRFQITAKVDIFEASVSIKIIEPPKATTLSVTPSNIKIEFEKTQKFKARILDQRGNTISGNIFWEVNEGGIINQNGEFTAGKTSGNFIIVVSANSLRQNIAVAVIEPPKLTEIMITPSIDQLEFGQSIQFQAQGIDQYGKNIQTGKVTWSSNGGRIDDSGIFCAGYQEETVTINATIGKVQKWKELRIYEPSRLTKIDVFPKYISLEPGQSTNFNIQAFDQYGADIDVSLFEVEWNATDGLIDQNGYFYSEQLQKGFCTVTVTVEDVSASAEVLIVPVLKEIRISPEEIEIKPDEEYVFSVTALDQVGDPIQITNVLWTATDGGSITREGVFKGNYKKREVIVEVNVNGISATAKVRLLPVLRRLKIKPEFVYLKPGEQQEFIIEGFDQFEKLISPGDIYWKTTGGKIDQQGNLIFEENEQGYFQVTATSQTIPKYTQNVKTLLLYVGVSSKIISYLISHDMIFRDLLSLNLELGELEPEPEAKSNESTISSEELEPQKTIELDIEQTIDDVEQLDSKSDDEVEQLSETETFINTNELDFSEVLEQWLAAKLQKLIARFFLFISRLCLSEARANLSASADVFVLEAEQNLYKKFECLQCLDEHSTGISSLAITPDGQFLISGSWDKTIKIWDLSKQELIDTLRIRSCVVCVKITPDGQKFISVDEGDETIKIWDLETRKIQNSISCPNVTFLDFITADDHKIVGSTAYGIIDSWNLDEPETSKTRIFYSTWYHWFRWNNTWRIWKPQPIIASPKQKRIVVGSRIIRFFDLETGKVNNIIGTDLGLLHALAITSDEKTLISGHGGVIKIWDLTAKQYPNVRLELWSSAEHICALSLTPDNKRLISASCEIDDDDYDDSWEHESFIEIWDLSTGERLHSIEDYRTGRIYSLAITPDGSKIISGYTDGMIKIWGIPELTLD